MASTPESQTRLIVRAGTWLTIAHALLPVTSCEECVQLLDRGLLADNPDDPALRLLPGGTAG